MKRNGKVVVITAKTYENLHQKIRGLEMQLLHEREHNEHTTRWAHKAFDEQRYLAKRCEFLYGEARSRGASTVDLFQPE